MGKLFTGTDGNDTVNGSEGDDYFYGYYGDDRLFGLGGFDILRGSFGNDYLDGGAGTDGLSGNEDNDVVLGGTGVDILRGDAGKDVMDGGDGNDILSGGEDADNLTGGAGADIFVYSGLKDSTSKGMDTIQDFDPTVDRIDLSSIDAKAGSAGGQTFTFLGMTGTSGAAASVPAAANSFAGHVFDAMLGLGNPSGGGGTPAGGGFTAEGQVLAYVQDGHTYIEANRSGAGKAEIVIDLVGEKQLTAANFILTGNVTNDNDTPTVKIGDGGFVHGENELTPNDPGALDTFTGGGGEDYLYGAFGNDTLYGGGDIDFVRGGGDDDKLYGGYGYDILDGSTGNDELYGGEGNFTDLLRGEDGNDLLDGGGGADQLSGGKGSDVFVFTGAFGNDTVLDFVRGVDTLQIAVDGVTGTGDLAFSGNTITIGTAGSITLNIDAGSLSGSDFEFI